jgi:hypothetical protein
MRLKMDRSTRMVFVGGALTLALLIAVIGSVSADSYSWSFAQHIVYAPSSQPL